MKKIGIYIIAVLLLTGLTVSGTYAFFTSTSNKVNTNTNSKKYEIIYNGGTTINATDLHLGASRSDGVNTSVNIKVGTGSVLAKANIYLNISQISSVIAKDGFMWEVVGIKSGNQVYTNSGHLGMCKTNNVNRACIAGDKLYIVNDYELSETQTTFTVYLWLDGNKLGNEVLGSTFSAYIGADTSRLTGQLR